MATFSMGISGSSVVNGTKTWTISDADVQALVDFMVFKFNDNHASPITPQQALLAWAQDFVNTTIFQVKQRQRELQVAEVNPPPIVFS